MATPLESAKKSLEGIGGTLVSGSTMLDEFKANRAARRGTSGQSVLPFQRPGAGALPPGTGYAQQAEPGQHFGEGTETNRSNPEIDALNAKLADIEKRNQEYDRQNRELRSLVDRSHGQLQALTSQRQQVKEDPIPAIEVEDPELAAVLNTFDQRISKKIDQAMGQQSQNTNRLLQNQQEVLFREGVDRVAGARPRFRQHFTDEQLYAFAQPYIANPQFVGVNWPHEMELAFRAKDYPILEQELAEAKKKLEQYEKKSVDQKKIRKEGLAMVPTGLGSGSSSSATTSRGNIADRILGDAKRRGVRLTTRQAFSEVRRAMGY